MGDSKKGEVTNFQMFYQPLLGADHIRDSNHGKIQGVRLLGPGVD